MEHRTSSVFFKVNSYFDFIVINAENASSHKPIVQDGRSTFWAISEIVGNSFLILIQIYLMNLFLKFKSAIQTELLKTKRNTVQRVTSLVLMLRN